jgi:hypothetical protein
MISSLFIAVHNAGDARIVEWADMAGRYQTDMAGPCLDRGGPRQHNDTTVWMHLNPEYVSGFDGPVHQALLFP